jgi:hypothetical protein
MGTVLMWAIGCGLALLCVFAAFRLRRSSKSLEDLGAVSSDWLASSRISRPEDFDR